MIPLFHILYFIQAELKSLQEVASASFTYAQDLIKHNLVVFRSGEGALQILPPLIDVLPEARLNLVIYYLRQGEFLLSNHLCFYICLFPVLY